MKSQNKVCKSDNRRAKIATVYIVRVAFMASMLTVAKFALSFVPNVEVVTLLICVYGSAMGISYALPATLVFCAVEVALYGVGSWVLLYFLYFSLLAVLSGVFLKGGRAFVAILFGTVGSALFGVLSACCDTLFCVGNLAPDYLGQYFVAYYVRGLYFDVVHIISNAVIMACAYLPLVRVARRLAPVACGRATAKWRLRNFMFLEYQRETTPPRPN